MPLHSVARVKTTAELVPTAIQCNVKGCTRTVAEHGEHEFGQDMHVIELSGGYGDQYPGDLTTISFVVCGTCLKAWADTFVIPPEERSEVFRISPTYEATHSETGETWVVDGLWAYPKGTEFKEPSECQTPTDVDYPTEGIWEHFKGRRYQVYKSILANPAEPEVVVVYRALYDDSRFWVRPARMWAEEVEHPEHEGRLVPRFRRIP